MPDKHALLSPSSAAKWLNCTPAPRLEAELPESTSMYAEEGRLAHSVCELAARKKFTPMSQRTYNSQLKKLKEDPLWDNEMLTTAGVYVEHLTENAMSFKGMPYIALEVKVDISDYVPEAYGTCDCVMIGGDMLYITDYKHGKGVSVSSQDNPQMMLYALGALKTYRPIYGDAIKRVVMYIDQPRLDSYDGWYLPVDELLAWGENTVKPKAAAAFAGIGEFAPGDWCRFCRAKAQCRARAGAQTALEDFKDCKAIPGSLAADLIAIGNQHGVEDMPPLLTDAEVGDLLKRGEALVEWYNSLKEYALKALLAGGEIPGWKAVEGRSTRAWSDQDKALEAIMGAGHPREIIYETVPKTLAQLEKLIGSGPFTELVGAYIIKPPGKPALAPESDKRPPYSGATADFGGTK